MAALQTVYHVFFTVVFGIENIFQFFNVHVLSIMKCTSLDALLCEITLCKKICNTHFIMQSHHQINLHVKYKINTSGSTCSYISTFIN